MADNKLSISSKKYKGNTAVISARISEDMVNKIDDIVEKTGRNRNEIIEMFIEFALENVVIGEDK